MSRGDISYVFFNSGCSIFFVDFEVWTSFAWSIMILYLGALLCRFTFWVSVWCTIICEHVDVNLCRLFWLIFYNVDRTSNFNFLNLNIFLFFTRSTFYGCSQSPWNNWKGIACSIWALATSGKAKIDLWCCCITHCIYHWV